MGLRLIILIGLLVFLMVGIVYFFIINDKDSLTRHPYTPQSTEDIPTEQPISDLTCLGNVTYGDCSDPPKYCDGGKLINDCIKCGCPVGQTCESDGSCKIKSIQKDFKMVFVLLTQNMNDVTIKRLTKLNEIKDAFSSSFKIATKNLATMDTSADVEIIVDSGINTASFDWEKYTKQFYETNEDDFDFISFYTTFSVGQSASHASVSNDIKGIGNLDLMDSSNDYGSKGKLKGINFMGDITTFERLERMGVSTSIEDPLNALKHETGHQWCCYIMDSREEGKEVPLRQQYIHWSFFLDLASINAGYNDPLIGNAWKEIDENEFEKSERLYIETRYSPLTLYLMGLISPEDVPSIPLIRPFDPAIEKSNDPPIRVYGTKQFITIQDIITREGEWNLT